MMYDKVEELRQALTMLPPDLENIERLLQTKKYTEYELAEAGNDLFCKCHSERYHFWRENYKLEYEEYQKRLNETEFHSNYILLETKLLLKYGFNPNVITINNSDNGPYNAIQSLRFIDFTDVVFDLAKLLFENGGNPNLVMPRSGSICDSLEYDAELGIYDEEQRSLKLFMIFTAYGGLTKFDTCGIKMEKGFDVSELLDVDKYTFGKAHRGLGLYKYGVLVATFL